MLWSSMPIEPVALSDFFLSFFSASMIILSATLYAVLYAWGKIRSKRCFSLGAALTFVALLACVIVFSLVNHFNGYWWFLSLTMVIGYAFMPRAIWYLCVATHSDESEH